MGELLADVIGSAGTTGPYLWVALGVWLAWRGSRRLHLAQGALLLFGAMADDRLQRDGVDPRWAAAAATAGTAVLGVAIYGIAVHPLRRASPVVRVAVLLAATWAATSLVAGRWGTTPVADAGLPTGDVEVLGSTVASADLLAAAAGVAATVAVLAYHRLTTAGLATRAAAPTTAALFGWSPRGLAATSWAAAGLLAGVGGVLLEPARVGGGLPWITSPVLFVLVVLRLFRRRPPPAEVAARLAQGQPMARAAVAAAVPVALRRLLARPDAVVVVVPLAPAKVPAHRLEVRRLRVPTGDAPLHGVDLAVEPGEILGVVGPNGAGKTTVLDAIVGLVRARGDVVLGGGRLPRGASRRARRGIGRSFEHLLLDEHASVLDHLTVGRRPMVTGAAIAVDVLGLRDDLRRTVGDLPPGRRRLVAVARAVAAGPSVVLLDEPFAGLDDGECGLLASLLRRLRTDLGMAVVVVERDAAALAGLCDRLVALDRGRVVAAGPPTKVGVDPAVIAAYLGMSEDEWAGSSAAA